jgi:branched-subunit amino acid aminotransferase/4-amino-4-deoxychorismate lyase
MKTMQAYLNGNWIPQSELAVPFDDTGFVLGATITEQLRTFAGKLFCLDEHLQRLFRSLAIIDLDPGIPPSEFAQIAETLVARNYPLLASGEDLGLGIFVTPGPYATISGRRGGEPTICLYTFKLPFHFWGTKFDTGESIVVSDVEQISAQSWPPELKCRSRMHYYLADRHAAKTDPGSRAVLLDRDGFVSEATTANVVLYRPECGLICPPVEKILPGISLSVLRELAEALAIPFTHRDVLPAELNAAAEVFLCSTSICMLPVVRCNGQAIGTGAPGPIFQKLLAAWSQRVGVDIAGQAKACLP